ncbi:MAG: type II toxin-antitoxin system Phd/YefM family antitoxin [Clostridia bacterium]|nr:type II toxin-antitoxin system Phd/YefM family antitoxin [Clostridia bacterium]MBR0386691.1 type II toxin-antitoxin system Phd/YefM family antitoxin [Clostridia bacterium]
MYNIRPVSDLRNKYTEIEESVLKEGEPVILTKNGYGAMVVMSLEQYAELTDEIELKLDEADIAAGISHERYTAGEVFSRVRERLHGKKAI